jgi:transcriptional regulator with XRE-family HTH domain
MELKKLFSERMKSARHKKGITQDQLSQITGISKKVISNYEQGIVLPGADNLQKITAALEITSDYLLFQHASPKEIPRIKDPVLYESYFILESLNEKERESALFLLNSIIAQKKLRELADLDKMKIKASV